MTKEWVNREKKNKLEELEDCISSERDNDHEVDDNDEVFLQVRVIMFCICIWYVSSNHWNELEHVFQMIIFVSTI